PMSRAHGTSMMALVTRIPSGAGACAVEEYLPAGAVIPLGIVAPDPDGQLPHGLRPGFPGRSWLTPRIPPSADRFRRAVGRWGAPWGRGPANPPGRRGDGALPRPGGSTGPVPGRGWSRRR